MSVSSGSDGRRLLAADITTRTLPEAALSMSTSMSTLHRKRPLLRSKAKTHSESLTTKTRSSTASKSVESMLKRKPSRYFADATFFFDDVPPLDDLSSEKLTPPILTEWIRAKGENFGSVYLVRVAIYQRPIIPIIIPVSLEPNQATN